MNRTILAFLVVTLSYQAALAGKYVIDEGESGDPEAYLEVDRDRQLVVMGCSVTNGNFNFGVAMPINNPAPGSMLETMKTDADVSIKGSVCVGAFCRQLNFARSDYFGGPETSATFDNNQIKSAESLEVDLPGVNLKWEGRVREVFRQLCR
jgi:hypothetical protein